MDFRCDSHVHVYGGAEYPFRTLATLQAAPLKWAIRQLRAVLDSHGLTHALLVQAQPYGYDNSCMLDAIAGSGGRFKGIALVDPMSSDKDLTSLVERGVVGFRANLSSFGMRELTEPGADRLLGFAREAGWFVEVHTMGDHLTRAMPILRTSGVRVIVDHFGRPEPARGLLQPGFQALLELGRSGNAVVKISGPFRSSVAGLPYRDIDPFVHAAIEAFTIDNCVWGSDWPFVPSEERLDYGPEMDCLERWIPDEALRQRLLWRNPARLFGF